MLLLAHSPEHRRRWCRCRRTEAAETTRPAKRWCWCRCAEHARCWCWRRRSKACRTKRRCWRWSRRAKRWCSERRSRRRSTEHARRRCSWGRRPGRRAMRRYHTVVLLLQVRKQLELLPLVLRQNRIHLPQPSRVFLLSWQAHKANTSHAQTGTHAHEVSMRTTNRHVTRAT